MLPTGTHGVRQRLTTEFNQRNLIPNIVAEIDSVSLLLRCVYAGIAATIEPLSAIQHEASSGRHWRVLPISDARILRRSYLYSLPSDMITPAVSAVSIELQKTLTDLVESNEWRGVQLLAGKV